MAHLTDMEELLARIPGSDIREYMREAMSCYMAGAYRGSLVLSYIALFDDLLAKLSELGNVNATAKTIFIEASKKKSDQDVYESYLIDQLTSNNLISGLDSSFLKTLRTLRNKSAHPSGHKPSPEEARFIFFETVDRFLSKPILSTTRLVDDLMARLKNTNFFPSATVPDLKNVVEEELANLHDEALPQLIDKIGAAVMSPDASTKKNASHFIIGLSRLDQPSANRALQTKLIESKADDENYQNVIIQAISANGKLFQGLGKTCVKRLRSILRKKISELNSALNETKLVHPTYALSSIAASIPEADFVDTFAPELEPLFEKRAHSDFIVKLVKNKPSLLPLYVPIMLKNAGSSDFSTSNSFSDAAERLDTPLSEVLTNEQAFHLIVAIMKAGKSNAWSAKALVDAKFAGVPSLRSMACEFITANEAIAAAYIAVQIGESQPMADFIAANLIDEEDDIDEMDDEGF